MKRDKEGKEAREEKQKMTGTKHNQQASKKVVTFTFSVRYYCRLHAASDDPIPKRGFSGM